MFQHASGMLVARRIATKKASAEGREAHRDQKRTMVARRIATKNAFLFSRSRCDSDRVIRTVLERIAPTRTNQGYCFESCDFICSMVTLTFHFKECNGFQKIQRPLPGSAPPQSVFEYLSCNFSRVLKISEHIDAKSFKKYEFKLKKDYTLQRNIYVTLHEKQSRKIISRNNPEEVEKAGHDGNGGKMRSWEGEPKVSVRLGFRIPSVASASLLYKKARVLADFISRVALRKSSFKFK